MTGEFMAQYPELVEVLRGYLEKLEVLYHAAAGLRAPVQAEEAVPGCYLPERGRLGDFHILREIGRGGMGIVYEAEQISRRRHVALKVLPFAAALNARPSVTSNLRTCSWTRVSISGLRTSDWPSGTPKPC